MIRCTVFDEDDWTAVVAHELFQKCLIGSTIKSTLTLLIDKIALVSTRA
jgi:hypothetical protein